MRTLMNVTAVMFFTSAGLWAIDGSYFIAIGLTMAGAGMFVLRTQFPVPGRD